MGRCLPQLVRDRMINYLRLQVSTLAVYLLELAIKKDWVPEQELAEATLQMYVWRIRKHAAQVRTNNG